jgi:FAD/FMN-containing dehydrogenase
LHKVQFDRRSVLKLAGGTVAYWAGSSLVHGAELIPANLKKSIAFQLAGGLPKLDGVFVFDDAVCRAMAADYGHYVHKVPVGVLFPKSAADIRKTVKYARAQKLKIAMRGHGCSAYGQAMVEGGIVIDASDFKAISWSGTDTLDVQPGATWHDIVEFALTRGFTPPVLPDVLFMTAGGTLNAGGIGETSYRSGAQVDHVCEMDVVTGAGHLVRCSPSQNDELYHAVLAGMGQCGLIVRARIQLEAAPPNVVTREFHYTDPNVFFADLKLISAAEPRAALVGKLARDPNNIWSYLVDVTTWLDGATETAPPGWLNQVGGVLNGTPKTMTYDTYVNRGTKSYLDSVANGTILVPHAYLSFYLPEDKAAGMIQHLATDADAAFGAAAIPLFPLLRSNFQQRLQSLPDSPLVYHIRVYKKAAQEGSAEHLKMIKVNVEDLVPAVLSAGGTVYPPHAPVLTQSQWKQHYSPEAFAFFASAKAKYDPDGILTPGAGIF